MKNPTRFPTHLITLVVALALGGFAVSITHSKAVFTAFALTYFSIITCWLVMTMRNRS